MFVLLLCALHTPGNVLLVVWIMEKNGEVRAYLAVVHGGCADEREISEAAIMAAAVAFYVVGEREIGRDCQILYM